jgi:hypothetical protein
MARIDVLGPDGKEYTLDVAEWSKAKANGFKLAKPPGQGEAALRGVAQGVTLGFGDEIAGNVKALASAPGDWLYEKLNPQDPTTSPSYMETYQRGRDETRSANAAAESEYPLTYGASEFAGSMVPMLAAPGSLPVAAGVGALYGAGNSEATDVQGLVSDAGLGAGGGLAGNLAGKAVAGVARRVANKAATGAASAQAKAAELATKSKTAPVKAAEGAYGGLRQTENKAILALLGLEEKGIISAANKAKLDGLRSSGRLADALNEAAANDLEFLGSRIGEVAAKKAESQALRAALPQEIADETARLLSPAEAGNQIMARVKRYGWPMLGSAVGSVVGGPVGAAVGALGGAGMRPAARAWMNMTRHPSVAPRLLGAVDNVASGVAKAAPTVAGAAGVAMAPQTSPVPSPQQLAQQDPVVGEAYQKGGSLSAAATFYSEAQKRPDEILSWLNEGSRP